MKLPFNIYALADAFDASLIPMWLYNPENLGFLAINDAAIDKYGYTREEFMAMTILDIRPKEDINRLMREVGSICRKGEADYNANRWRHVTRDGHIFHAEVFCTNFEYNGKSVRLVQAIDVDEKVKEERQRDAIDKLLDDHGNHLNFILSSINEVAWLAYADNLQLVYTNEACTTVFGYSSEEMILDRDIFKRCIHPEDLEDFIRSFKTMHTKGRVESTFRIYRKDGQLRYLKGTAVLKKGKDGHRDMCAGLTVDITDRKIAEDSLRQQKSNLKALINHSDNLIWSFNNDYRLISANDNYVSNVFQFTGLWLQQGDRLIDMPVGAELARAWKENYARVLSGESFKVIDTYCLQGVTVYTETSFTPMVDEGGRIIGGCCQCCDVTERLNYLRKVELQNRQLKEIAQMQSHQVRGPVATIMGLQQLMNLSDPADPINGEVLNGISESLIKLDMVIKEIDKRTY
jgi:PAS domain S-box-containing protein